MCNNPNCGPNYPLKPIVKSTSVTNAANLCTINVPDFTLTAGSSEFILEIDQAIIPNDVPVDIFYQAGTLFIEDRWGNEVHADQFVKAIAQREKAKCTTCPCAVAQFRMRKCYTPGRFVVLCDLPRSNTCTAHIELVQIAEVTEDVAPVAAAVTAER